MDIHKITSKIREGYPPVEASKAAGVPFVVLRSLLLRGERSAAKRCIDGLPLDDAVKIELRKDATVDDDTPLCDFCEELWREIHNVYGDHISTKVTSGGSGYTAYLKEAKTDSVVQVTLSDSVEGSAVSRIDEGLSSWMQGLGVEESVKPEVVVEVKDSDG